ncbi:MAG: type II toxin-antitoxin system RelE/ParE family toxin [Terriglobia bacterium]
MIRSFGDAGTARFAKGARVKQFEPFRRQAEKTLDRLDAATGLRDLANFPGHHLEKLKGDRAGAYSIRINDRWRICFAWPEGASGSERVTIEDYHD